MIVFLIRRIILPIRRPRHRRICSDGDLVGFVIPSARVVDIVAVAVAITVAVVVLGHTGYGFWENVIQREEIRQ